MARIECSIEDTLVEDKAGQPVAGICLTCGECDTSVEGPGSSDDGKAVRELAKAMRTKCPYREQNHYVVLVET